MEVAAASLADLITEAVAAHRRMRGMLTRMGDDACRAPSLPPGWSLTASRSGQGWPLPQPRPWA